MAIILALAAISGGMLGFVITTPDVSMDGDSVPLTAELLYGTNPFVADTDGDGLDDGAEIVQYDTDPTERDTDQDFLQDRWEIALGTDPTEADTDHDGYYDGLEVKADQLASADPLRKDVFVELDWMEGTRPRRSTLEPVTDAYAEAPTYNPSGQRGIALHIIYSNQVAFQENITNESVITMSQKHRDFEECGYHHAIAVNSINPRRFKGYYIGSTSAFAFETTNSTLIPHFFMHELGHGLGLGSSDFEGIDSQNISASNYSSVMNYNAVMDLLQYNSGTPHDDWGRIKEELPRRNGRSCAVTSMGTTGE